MMELTDNQKNLTLISILATITQVIGLCVVAKKEIKLSLIISYVFLSATTSLVFYKLASE